MNNLVFLPRTFAEIYTNTPAYLRNQSITQYKTVFVANIEYGYKPAEVYALFDLDNDITCLVITDTSGKIL